MRLDKFLANKDICSRKESKKFVKKNMIAVNGKTVNDVSFKLQENDEITINDNLFIVNEFKYFVMNKPVDCVCANQDDMHETIFDYLSFEDFQNDLFTVGRLDKDTTGLIIITNDGKLSHNLMSPKHHIDKCYHVTIEKPLTANDISQLEAGLIIDFDYHTLPAKVEVISDNQIFLTISEGKYHQVKRMLQAVDNNVTKLERVKLGNFQLPLELVQGDYEAYTLETLEKLLY